MRAFFTVLAFVTLMTGCGANLTEKGDTNAGAIRPHILKNSSGMLIQSTWGAIAGTESHCTKWTMLYSSDRPLKLEREIRLEGNDTVHYYGSRRAILVQAKTKGAVTVVNSRRDAITFVAEKAGSLDFYAVLATCDGKVIRRIYRDAKEILKREQKIEFVQAPVSVDLKSVREVP